LAAATLEGGRLARWSWSLTPVDYRRIWDFSGALFVFLAVYFYSSQDLLSASHAFLLWLPLIFFPIILAQWFGPLEKIDYRVFWWWLRFRSRAGIAVGVIGIAPLYFALCLFSTTVLNMNAPSVGWFYLGFGLIAMAALWQIRPRHYALWVWIMAMILAAGAGFEGQRRLHQLQEAAEKAFANWLMHRSPADLNANESRTAIGQIGRVKLSGRIVLRVETQPGQPTPSLLRQATYNVYGKETWVSRQKSFSPVTPEDNENWAFPSNAPSKSQLKIAGYFSRGEGLLSLPRGTARIENLPSHQMEFSPMGAVRVKEAPGFVQFRACYGPGNSIDSDFGEEDLQVPPAEEKVITEVANELAMDARQPKVALQALQRFFIEKFRYTTYLGTAHEQSKDLTPLGDFLLRKRAGHCEYFATATVLLLRKAGIPARYAVGYAIHESNGKNQYVVRERHGHAWCQVYRADNKAWEDFDTTPDSWLSVEERNASLTQPLSDFFSRLWFEFSKWRYGAANLRNYILIGLAIAVVLLGLQILLQRRRKQAAGVVQAATIQHWPGGDSEFYEIERFWAGAGWGRAQAETPRQWWLRLRQNEASLPAGDKSAELLASLDLILRLHYRHRFDPEGLPAAERAWLREQSQAWLASARRYKMATTS